VTELLQFTLFGLMLGCVYAVAAMGLVLTYTVTGVFNFAHGAVGMLAAFGYYELRVKHDVPTPVAVVLVVAVMGPAAGLLAERMLRRFRGADYATSLVVTIALTIGLLGLATQAFDPAEARNVPFLFGNRRITVASVPISYDRLFQVVVAVAVAFGLRFLLFGTPTGARMRAVVDDPELARLKGVRSIIVARLSWMIGFALAALGGVLFAGGQNINAIVLTLLVLNAYGAAMVGRLTSLPMTCVGALLLGLIQELTNVTWLWPEGDIFLRARLALPGIFLIAAVLLVPSFRLSAGRIVGKDQPRTPTVRGAALAGVGLVAAVTALVQIAPDRIQGNIAQAAVMATIALSLVALTGLSGQVSLTQYVFVGLGAFVAGKAFGGDSVFGMLFGGVVASGAAVLAALPAVRLRGLHLALSTFGFALVGREVVLGDQRIFGLAGINVPRPDVLGFSTSSNGSFATYATVVFTVLAVGVVAIRRSWFGRQLTALRDSELAAATLGMKVQRAKVGIFAVSGFIAGCAGSLFGGLAGAVSSTSFEPVSGLVIVLFAFVGGITTITGAAVAGSLFALLSYVESTYPDLAGVVFIGIAAAAIGLGRQPNGLAGIVYGMVDRVRAARAPGASSAKASTSTSAPASTPSPAPVTAAAS
jgi:branched-chain amino acid transport system permease protein